MVVKKTRKPAAKKKTASRKPRVSGIASYVKKLFASPAVKKAASAVKALELKLTLIASFANTSKKNSANC